MNTKAKGTLKVGGSDVVGPVTQFEKKLLELFGDNLPAVLAELEKVLPEVSRQSGLTVGTLIGVIGATVESIVYSGRDSEYSPSPKEEAYDLIRAALDIYTEMGFPDAEWTDQQYKEKYKVWQIGTNKFLDRSDFYGEDVASQATTFHWVEDPTSKGTDFYLTEAQAVCKRIQQESLFESSTVVVRSGVTTIPPVAGAVPVVEDLVLKGWAANGGK